MSLFLKSGQYRLEERTARRTYQLFNLELYSSLADNLCLISAVVSRVDHLHLAMLSAWLFSEPPNFFTGAALVAVLCYE